MMTSLQDVPDMIKLTHLIVPGVQQYAYTKERTKDMLHIQ